MKWFWRAYKINGSFQTAFKQIGGIEYAFSSPHNTTKYVDIHKTFSNEPFIYVAFDGTIGGNWKLYEPGLDDKAYKETIEWGYEFKGNVGIKEKRKIRKTGKKFTN